VPPLSERERKILEEIERGLDDEAPSFVVDKDLHLDPRRPRIGKGIASFIVGLSLLVAFFATSSIVLGVLAFAAMVAGIVLLAGSVSILVESKRVRTKVGKQSFRRSVEGLEARLRNRNRRP
jgi:Protein of unknown function (DUF3040)